LIETLYNDLRWYGYLPCVKRKKKKEKVNLYEKGLSKRFKVKGIDDGRWQ